jgi:hypothetical protein
VVVVRAAFECANQYIEGTCDGCGRRAGLQDELVGPSPAHALRGTLNFLDLRFNKILRAGGTRLSVGVDLYNAMNVSTVLSQNNNFAAWQVPTAIVTPRFAKFNLTVDF